jgi:hypothetical protein
MMGFTALYGIQVDERQVHDRYVFLNGSDLRRFKSQGPAKTLMLPAVSDPYRPIDTDRIVKDAPTRTGYEIGNLQLLGKMLFERPDARDEYAVYLARDARRIAERSAVLTLTSQEALDDGRLHPIAKKAVAFLDERGRFEYREWIDGFGRAHKFHRRERRFETLCYVERRRPESEEEMLVMERTQKGDWQGTVLNGLSGKLESVDFGRPRVSLDDLLRESTRAELHVALRDCCAREVQAESGLKVIPNYRGLMITPGVRDEDGVVRDIYVGVYDARIEGDPPIRQSNEGVPRWLPSQELRRIARAEPKRMWAGDDMLFYMLDAGKPFRLVLWYDAQRRIVKVEPRVFEAQDPKVALALAETGVNQGHRSAF